MDNITKFRKALAKRDNYRIGFSEIPEWICTGNMGLNAIISGDPRKGIPVRRTAMFSGLQGTGKSFLAANIAKNAQDMGYFTIFLDTENSLTDGYMEAIGVNLEDEWFMPVNVYSIEETVAFFSDVLKNTDPTDKIGIFVDSLSNLETEKDMKKFEDGDVAYSQGLKEKLYKQLVRNINSKVGHRDMFAMFNTHMYVNGSDAYGNPILRPSCGEGTQFIPSVGVQLQKTDLKDGKEQVGINIKAKTYKTRYTSLGKKAEFALPWDRGMDLYDGVLPFLEDNGVVDKNGGWYSFDNNGEIIKFQKSTMNDHIGTILDAYYGGKEIVESDEGEDGTEDSESE